MYLGDDNLNAAALPWATAYRPDMGVVDGDAFWVHAAVAAREAFKQAGYSGPLDLDVWIPDPNFGGEGPAGRYEPHPHPDALAFLRSRGYTLKVADIDKGGQGTSYGSLWDAPTGNIKFMSGYDWTNKKSFVDKLVIGVLAGIATAGVASAVSAAAGGAASGGAAASGALPSAAEIGAVGGQAAGAAGTAAATAIPSASGLIPAATAAIPATSALKSAAPSVATGGAVAPPAAAVAPPVTATSAGSILPTVMKAVPAVTSAVKAVQAVQNAQTKAAVQPQMPIAPPANMIDTNLIPGGTPKYDVQFQQPTPPWLIPSIIAGIGLVAVMMMNRRKTAR